MSLDKIYIYNPITKQGFQQSVNEIMKPAIEAIYVQLDKNFDALFKRKEWLSLEPIGLEGCALEITGYAGTGLYKVYKDGELVVLGEVFTNKKEIEKFGEDLKPELKKLYDGIEVAPAQTVVFAKNFYSCENRMQEGLFSFCRLLGFSVVPILKKHTRHEHNHWIN